MRLEIRGTYPPDWLQLSRATKDDAGWRCVRCHHPFDSQTGAPLACDDTCDLTRGRFARYGGRHDSPGADAGGFNYGVHHLDGDKSNQSWWNRIALCNSCHLFVQARVLLERPWLFEHSPWFIPYVCGFYARYYADLEISREAAIAEPDRWLALGQPWRYETAVAP